MPETENIKTTESSPWKGGIKKWLNSRWVVKNIYYFLFLGMLAIIYIYNGHYAENTIKDINRNAKALKELQYEYKTVKGELMMRGKESELAKAVEPMGLKPLKVPPVTIIEKSKN
ncbi:MAG TPA: FtsL-like putative cell division protein [Agriterribacter sp.]|nr:FtsL-like putative cell division protein [Agriterribacter sp.]